MGRVTHHRSISRFKLLLAAALCVLPGACLAPVASAAGQAPKILEVFPGPVASDSATITSLINPRGEAGSYAIELGTVPCAEGGCSTIASGPLAPVGSSETLVATASGLVPSTQYRVRVTAENASGEAVAKEASFRTFGTVGQSALPDGRAYELVSAGSEPAVDYGSGDHASGFAVSAPQRASIGGGASTFTSFNASDPSTGSPAAVQYLATRTATGWTASNIAVPGLPTGASSTLFDPFVAFSPDLSQAAVGVKSPADEVLAPGAVPGYENLYLRDNYNGAYLPITTQAPTKIATGQEFCVRFAGADPTWTHIFFLADAALTADAPQPTGVNLYEWTASGGLQLVSVGLASGIEKPVTSAAFAGAEEDTCGYKLPNLVGRAISESGESVVFTGFTEAGAALYDRIDASRTVQVDAAQGGPGPSGGGLYLDASADGSRILFTDENSLIAGAARNDLYLYDVATGRLADLTLDVPAEETGVDGVFGTSADLSVVYFASLRQLTQTPNSEGEVAKEYEGQNIYLWREGEPLRYVGNVEFDPAGFSRGSDKDAFVSADGNTLAFTSTVGLTHYDNQVRGTPSCEINNEFGSSLCSEVYLYDAGIDRLLCASCNPSGAPHSFDGSLADTQLPPGVTALASIPLGPGEADWLGSSRNHPLSTDGRRLFFKSFDRLVPRDTNSAMDVYEFERLGTGSCTATAEGFNPESDGCVALVSGGNGSYDSYFLDATPDGDEAQISTNQALLPIDQDQSYDVYAARVGGGFPESSIAGSCADEESCRPAPSAAPAVPPISSSTSSGNGNVTEPKPQKPKPRLRRCRKAHGKQKHQKKERCVSRRSNSKARHRRGPYSGKASR